MAILLLNNNCSRSKKAHNKKGLLPQRNVQTAMRVEDATTN